MINANLVFEKNGFVGKNTTSNLFLLKLEGLRNKAKNSGVKQKKINLSIALDTSGSMAEGLKNNGFAATYNSLSLMREHLSIENRKIEMAKKSILNIIDSLKNGDIFSVVLFSNVAKRFINPLELSDSNREQIKNQIRNINASGGTNLYDGLIESSKCVTENLSDKNVNHIILISDGHTCVGELNVDKIGLDVSVINDLSKISFSSFGIGLDFNEVLLTKILSLGAGNFFYIEKDSNLDDYISIELDGVKNVSGSSVRFKLDFKDGFSNLSSFNDLAKDEDGFFKLNNVRMSSVDKYLFKFNIDKTLEKDGSVIGHMKLIYSDENGNLVTINSEISLNVVSNKSYKDKNFNTDVKNEELILTLAQSKKKAQEAAFKGDLNAAREILSNTSVMLQSYDGNSDDVLKEINSINHKLDNFGSFSGSALSKTLSFEVYGSTRNYK